MNLDELTIEEALARTAAAAAALGFDVAESVARITDFLAAPFVVAAVGLPGTGRSLVAGAVVEAVPGIRTLRLEIRDALDLLLWDLLVVVTPAERALSREEAQLVRSARRLNHPVLVLVTRAQVLGEAAERAAAEAQIARVQLVPALGPLGVPWFFHAEGEPLGGLVAAVRGAAHNPAAGRRRPAVQALSRTLQAFAAHLEERVAERDAQSADLRDLLGHAPSAGAFLAEQAALARIRVLDPLRTAEDRLFEAAGELPKAAVAWLASDGLGAWSDVEHTFRVAREHLVATASGVLADARRHLHGEIDRLAAMYAQMARRLDLAEPQPARYAASWAAPEADAALAALAEADLEPLLLKLEKITRDELGKREQERGRAVELKNKAVDSMQGRPDARLEDELRDLALRGLEAVLRSRLERLVGAQTEAAGAGAHADLAVATEWLATVGANLRSALDERHAWGGAYGELLELRAWAGRTGGAHGD